MYISTQGNTLPLPSLVMEYQEFLAFRKPLALIPRPKRGFRAAVVGKGPSILELSADYDAVFYCNEAWKAFPSAMAEHEYFCRSDAPRPNGWDFCLDAEVPRRIIPVVHYGLRNLYPDRCYCFKTWSDILLNERVHTAGICCSLAVAVGALTVDMFGFDRLVCGDAGYHSAVINERNMLGACPDQRGVFSKLNKDVLHRCTVWHHGNKHQLAALLG